MCYPEVANNKYLGTVSKYTFQVPVLEYFFFFFLMTFYFYTIHSFAHKYLYFPHLGLEKHARDCCVLKYVMDTTSVESHLLLLLEVELFEPRCSEGDHFRVPWL